MEPRSGRMMQQRFRALSPPQSPGAPDPRFPVEFRGFPELHAPCETSFGPLLRNGYLLSFKPNRFRILAIYLCMGSINFEGVRFEAYSNDHDPMHVHGFYAEVEVIVELRRDRTVLLASRKDAVRPRNGSRSDVRHVLAVANKHFDELVALLEK